MKNVKKILVGMIAILILCTSGFTALAEVADNPIDAVGCFTMYNAEGKYEVQLDAACVATAEYTYVFMPPLGIDEKNSENKKFTFRLAGQEIEYNLELFYVTNAYTCFLVKDDQIPCLEIGTWADAQQIGVLYYDADESRRVLDDKVEKKSEAQKGTKIYVLDNVPASATPGAAILDLKTNHYIGMLLSDQDGNAYCVSVEHIAATLKSDSDAGTESSKKEGSSEKEEGSETEEGSEEGSGSEKKESKNHSVTFLSVLMGIVVVGLILLIIRANASNNVAVPGMGPVPTPGGDAVGRVCIRGEGGIFNGRKFEIDGSVTIGRQTEKCNVCYPANAKGVSGLHCQLRRAGAGVELIDLGSSYGTYVNGTKIAPNTPVMLRSGDRFYLANATNTFVVY